MQSMSNFNFNLLIIIQSLRDNDRKIGEELNHKINEWSNSREGVDRAKLFDINSMKEWDDVWNNINDSITSLGISPIIHLVMHGNETHIGLNGGDNGIITLPDLYHKIQIANELTRNNIFLSMAVCEGLNVSRSLHIMEHMPFCGILASQHPLFIDPALENFTLFYKSLFSTLNVNQAFDELITNGKESEKYSLVLPEQIFMNAMAGYLATQSKKSMIPQRADTIAREGGIVIDNPIIKEEFDNCVGRLVEQYDEELYPKFVNTFFMFDLFPEIRDRFSIPDNLSDFKALAKANGIDLE